MRTTLATMMIAVTLAAASIAIVDARQRRELPDVPLLTLDGTAERSSSLVRDGHWLLIYVEPNCGACSAVLGAIRRDENPGMAESVAVIVGRATTAQAQALAEASTELANARWFVDVNGGARQALAVRSAPLASGLRGNSIEWSLTGALRQSTEMTSVLVSWLRQSPPAGAR